MSATEDSNRFNIPVETLIRELVADSHPGFDASPGSAFYDAMISPSAVVFQHFRDYSKVIQRNQSLSNYSSMLPEELDRLTANFGVNRAQGSRARGIQRVTFPNPESITVTAGVIFSDGAGHSYRPVATTSITAEGMTGNIIAATGEYYLDINIAAILPGQEYTVEAGAITSVTGISNSLRTFNPARMTTGLDAEGNAQLYSKTLQSISNRDLVTDLGIQAAIIADFPAVRQVKVVGYGDPEMTRDTVTVNLSDQAVFERSYAKKVNLPLDGNGNVLWTYEDGTPITAPIGGYVGAIVDEVGRDFGALKVSIDGIHVEYVAAQQNFTTEFLSEDDPDYGKTFMVTRVEEVPVAAGGDPVRILRLDQPLSDTTVPSNGVITNYPYTCPQLTEKPVMCLRSPSRQRLLTRLATTC